MGLAQSIACSYSIATGSMRCGDDNTSGGCLPDTFLPKRAPERNIESDSEALL